MYFVFLVNKETHWKGEDLKKGKYITNNEEFISFNQISCKVVKTFKKLSDATDNFPEHKLFLIEKEPEKEKKIGLIAETVDDTTMWDTASTATITLEEEKDEPEERVYLEELVEKLEEKTID
jgi:hypothetical protein